MSRLLQTAIADMRNVQVRYQLARLGAWFLPVNAGARVRTQLLRLAGFQIGHGTIVLGMPTVTGVGDLAARLSIGQGCLLNKDCLLDLSAPITIGHTVGVGHEAMLLTGSHDIGASDQRAGRFTAQPIVVGNGSWIGARSLILPGVTIGEGAVVAAGSVVTKDVTAQTLVAGVPAETKRVLDQYYVHSDNGAAPDERDEYLV